MELVSGKYTAKRKRHCEGYKRETGMETDYTGETEVDNRRENEKVVRLDCWMKKASLWPNV